MSSEILDWVCRRLGDDDEVIQPLKKLWKDWHTFHDGPPFDEFATAVLGDERFEKMYCIDHDPDLEALGCFSGPRIKLRSREITPHHVLVIFRKHNERIAKILMKASEVLNGDSGTGSSTVLDEAVQMIEVLRPAFNPWVHFRPGRGRSRP